MSTELRPELPDLIPRIARLPVHRGYPVPWFVAWLNEAGDAVAPGEGVPDFRIIAPGAVSVARIYKRCWICGDTLGSYVSFVAGSMCAVTRTSSEPPSHTDCALWAAQACPFLTRPHMERREGGLPEEAEAPAGIMLTRNPGVAVVWTTRASRVATFSDSRGGTLFNMGNPVEVRWLREGRPATREEVQESLDSGLPALEELAREQGLAAQSALARQLRRALATL